MPERVPAYTAAAVRAAEQPLLAAGVPLMARASAALAHLAAEELRPGESVLVLAGRGDNGGDALFAAALLAERGVPVHVLRTASSAHAEGLAAALAAGAREVDDPGTDAALILDGILGIGASGDPALRSPAREIVTALLSDVQAGRRRVVAVDLPSGLQPDDGRADGAVLPAAVTVTFGAVKAGLVRGHGPALTGRLVLADIGLDLTAATPVATASVDRVYRA